MALRSGLPTVADSRPMRLLLFFVLYVSQGVTFATFTFAVPGWMAANGASAAAIGAVVSAAGLPWSLKFLNGILMDRFTFLAMGRRRSWLIGGQGVVLLGMFALAARNPAVGEVALLSAFAFGLNLAINFQDVATDGMAADLVPEAERARTNGVMFGGQAIGVSGATAIGGMLLADFGMTAAALACSSCILIGMALVMACRERPGERLLPWTKGTASAEAVAVHSEGWGELLRAAGLAVREKQGLLLASVATISGIGWGLGLGAQPLLATQTAGMSQATYSALQGSGSLVGGMLGLLVFGFVADLIGPLKLYRVALALFCATIGAMLLAQPFWGSPWPITLTVLSFFTLRTMQQIPYGALSMGLCVPAIAATHMTFFMTMANLGSTIGSLLIGPVNGFGGIPAMLGVMMGCYLSAFCLAMMLRIGERPSAAHEERGHVATEMN
jgi:MFS transporter, PAT family, beta-lactamase induction signal transducer AmpG